MQTDAPSVTRPLPPFAAITVFVFILIAAARVPMLLSLLIIGLTCGLLSLFVIQALLVYLGAILGLSLWLSTVSIDLGPFIVYGVDALLLLLLYAGVHLLATRGAWLKSPREERLVIVLLLAFCIYGLFQIPYGLLAKGYPYNEVFGDYRRLFFYNFALIPPLWLSVKWRQLDSLKYVIAGGMMILIGIGIYRFVFNEPVRLDENMETGHTGRRMLAVAEFSIAALFLGYLTGVVALRAQVWARLAALGLAGLVASLMVLSGFRLAVVYAGFAPVFALVVLTYMRGRSFATLARHLLLAGLLAVLLGAVAAAIFREQFDKAMYDLEVRRMDMAVTGDYRVWTTRQALIEWRDNRVFGTGIGHELVFPTRTRQGHFRYMEATAHSTLTAIMYQSGLVGLGLFAALHGAFVLYVVSQCRRVPKRFHAVFTGLVVGYVCLLGASFTQPLYLAGYAAIGLLMGFTLRLLRPEEDVGPAAAGVSAA